jgi:type I restriction-modification system DNA methylase subunit
MNSQQARALVVETFPQIFDKGRFRQFIINLLNHIDESKAQSWNSTYIKHAFKDHVQKFERLGTYTSPDDEKLDVLIVHLTTESKLERARTAIRNFVADHLKTRDGKDAALVAFLSPSERSWRFSYIKMEYAAVEKDDGKVDVQTKLTPARRSSYIVGEDESCHTAQSRFLDLLQDTENHPTLAQIEDAFSVEAVTKEFFEQYKGLFLDLKDELDDIAKKDQTIGAEFAAKNVSTADFAKKLMGQIVFLYFLQKKGWLGVAKNENWGDGKHNFLRQLFDGKFGNYKNFFNDILEPLFYDTLATDRGHDAWCSIFKCRIPFLNGGLFEPVAGYDWKKTDITIPNSLFSNSKLTEAGDKGTGILDVFDRYNFTVNEAEPLEKEVAIDPEMLGKVFENLLEVTERKSKGSFYTPREIVHYMCQESLINYLDTAVNSKTEIIGTEKRTQALLGSEKAEQTLLTVPTRGEFIPRTDIEIFIHSGDQASHYEAARKDGTSYKRSLPKRIETHAKLLDEKLADIAVCDPAIGSGAFPVGMMQEIVRARSSLTPYFNDVKDRTAYHFKRHAIQNCIYGVDIDSGAVEIAKLRLWLSLVVDEEDVKQIKPLPNLDYKIVVGNSLVGFPFKSKRLQEVEALKIRYFDEANHDIKAKLKRQIDNEIAACFAAAKKSLGYQVTFDFESFFSEIFTGKGGFDVVIGNPPYINIEKIPKLDRTLFLQIYGENGKIGQRYDVYQLFIMKGMVINATGGTLAYILPNTFLTGSSYIILRRRLCSRTSILGIVDLPQNVFESAMVDNVLLFLRKENVRQNQIQVAKLHTNSEISKIASKSWDDFFTIPQDNLNEENEFKLNVHLNPVLQRLYEKIESSSIKLGDITESSQGIIIYTTEAEAQRNKYTSSQAQKGWKKLLRGTNIGYYSTKWGGEYLHYGDWLCRSRDEKFFNQPKILLQAMRNKSLKRRLVATYDKDFYYNAHNLANIISKPESGYYLKFILAIFNSTLINHWYRNHFPNVNINPNDFREIPIRITNAKEQALFTTLVDRILAAKAKDAEADVSKLEREIDELVYALYGLTQDEIKIVEGTTK